MSAIERMIDEMKRREYADKTIKEYTSSIRRLADHFGCCPSELTLEQVREYLANYQRTREILEEISTINRELLRRRDDRLIHKDFQPGCLGGRGIARGPRDPPGGRSREGRPHGTADRGGGRSVRAQS